VEGDLEGYRALLVGDDKGQGVLEKAAKSTHIIQYILVLAADLINGTAMPSAI
jgi:hypothetical protein